MPSLKELQEKRGAAVNEIKRLRDIVANEDRDFTQEEREAWDKANAEYDTLSGKIDILKRGEDLSASEQTAVENEARSFRDNGEFRKHGINSPETLEERKNLAMQGWANFQMRGELTDEQRDACETVGVNPNSRELPFDLYSRQQSMAELEKRALDSGTGNTGGYLVPSGFINRLELAMLKYGPMLQVAEIMRTESGEDLLWPTANDTSADGELVGQSAAVSSNEDPAFGKVTFGAYKGSSKIIKVPVELLEDSAVNLVQLLADMIGERLGRLQNGLFTTGTGTSQPKGIVTAATAVGTATATTLAADDLVNLYYSVDGAYRENATFMMNDGILKAIRKFKDSQGQYLWQPSYQQGQPEMLLGKAVYANSNMASAVANSAAVVLFGDMRKYKVRQVKQVRMRRLVELYAGDDQEGFVGFLRFDGNLLDAGSHPVKKLMVKAA